MSAQPDEIIHQSLRLKIMAALHAEPRGEALEFSRSNVSMGLKELQAWRLVKLKHLAGDRREYFEAPGDVWEIFRVLAEERRRREIEPTLSMLRNALLEEPATEADRFAQDRMRQMHELIDRLMTWFDDVQKLAPETAMQLMGMGATVMVTITLDSQSEEAMAAFEAAVADSPSIIRCHLMSGRNDYLLVVRAASIEDYEIIHRQEIARLPRVARIETAFALREVVNRTVPPRLLG